jgi:endoglucanase
LLLNACKRVKGRETMRKCASKKILQKAVSLLLAVTFLVPFMSMKSMMAFAADDTAATPVNYYGQLQASGNRINGAKTNSPAQLTGMSFFWNNWSGQFYTAATVDRMVDEMNCEIVRATYGIQDDGTPYDGNEAAIRAVVDEAINRGIYVIIDWHAHHAQNNVAASKDFFSRMAKDYGQYDNVIFELYNEPMNVDWGTIKGYAEQVIPAIRQYSDNLIVVGTPNWSQDVDVAASNRINDPNLAYTLHFYAGTHKADLRAKADNALNAGISLFVTEWGSVNADGNGGVDSSSTQEWFNWMNERKISSCNWAVNDKAETSSIFSAGSGPNGSLSDTGNYIKGLITNNTANALWRKAVPAEPSAIPGTIEAENYSSMSGIQLETCSEGGQDLGWVASGDSATYQVNVAAPGTYQVDLRVASKNGGGALEIQQGSDGAVLGSVSVPQTGDWQTWTTVSTTVQLQTAGAQSIKLLFTSEGLNLNWIKFSQAEPATPAAPAITTSSLPAAVVGTAYNQTLTVAGTGTITWSVSAGSLPAGLALSADGKISGTPTAEGASTFTVSASNGTAPDAAKEFSITVGKQNTAVKFAGPVDCYGQLNANGNKIYGSKINQKVAVNGISLFWSCWADNTYNAAMVDRLVDDFDAEIVRAAYGVSDNGGPEAGSSYEQIDRVVDEAIKRNIYVIIDYHGHYADKNVADAKAFFDRMSSKYGQYDNVLFEVWNEPKNDATWPQVKSYAEQIIPVIRKNSDNLIIVGSPWWSQKVNEAADNPITMDKNIAYTLHFYIGNHGQELRDQADYALNKGLPIFITEWGMWNSTSASDADVWMDWARQRDLSTCMWSAINKDEPSSIFNSDYTGLRTAGTYIDQYLAKWAQTATWRQAAPEPVAIPGVVEAENYSAMSGVQKETCAEGGSNIGYIDDGDWTEYLVNAAAAGTYKIEFRVASKAAAGTIGILSNGNKVGSVTVSPTGDYQNWTSVTANVTLEAGSQTIRLAFSGSGFNVNWIKFSQAEPAAPTAPAIATNSLPDAAVGTAYNQTLTATGTGTITWSVSAGSLPAGLALSEDGKISGTPTADGTSTFSVMASNGTAPDAVKQYSINVNKAQTADVTVLVEAESYTQMSGIQTEACTEGTKDIGWIDNGDWALYSVNFPQAGSYKVEMRVASPNNTGVIRIEQNAGSTLLGSISVPSTGGYQNWTTVSTTITVGKAGVQDIGLGFRNSGFNINWIKFSASSGSSSTPSTDEAPSVITASLPNGKVGAVYDQTLTASGTSPIAWSVTAGSLPVGLELNADGKLTGTPTAAGTYTFTATASNTASSASKQLTVTIEDSAQASNLTVSGAVRDNWGTGYSADIVIKNSGTETVTNWTVTLTCTADITYMWDATIQSKSGNTYVITGTKPISAGQSVSFGYVGSGNTEGPRNLTVK